MATHIPSGLYREILESLPIACVDLIIKREGKILLVKRTNEPLANEWWTPGGRIRKGESPLEAARRKSWDEVGLVLLNPRFVGFLNDEYYTSSLGVPCQCISLICESNAVGTVILNSEASEWKLSESLPERFMRKTMWATSTIYKIPESSSKETSTDPK